VAIAGGSACARRFIAGFRTAVSGVGGGEVQELENGQHPERRSGTYAGRSAIG